MGGVPEKSSSRSSSIRKLALAVALTLLWQQPASTQEQQPQASPSDTSENAATHRAISDELQARNRDLGPDFAGAWIDPTDRGRIFLGFKGKPAAEEARRKGSLSAMERNPNVEFIDTQFSQAEQVAAIDRAATKLRELLPTEKKGFSPFFVTDNTPENAVDVFLDPSLSDRRDEVDEALAKDIESGLVRVKYREGMQRLGNTCVSRDGCHPIRAGLGINGANCTSGFVFRNDLGTRFMSTADHCNFGTMTHNSNNVGPRMPRNDAVDVAIYDITNPNLAQPNNSVYRGFGNDPETDTRITTKVSSPNSMLVGELVCAEGAQGDTSCGHVTGWSGSDAEYCCLGSANALQYCPGDSGAPVVRSNDSKAFGMISSGNPNPCAGGSTWAWTSAAEQYTGYTIILNRATQRLKGNQGLRGRYENQRLDSPNGEYTVRMQSDGNFVLYRTSGGTIWRTGTAGNANAYIVMQADGNLVLYTAGGTPICATNTSNRPGAYLRMQDDGNLVLYDANNIARWKRGPTQTTTGCYPPSGV